MNNVYRVVWNATHGVWQAVSEIASAGGKTKSVKVGRVARSGASARHAAQFVVAGLSMACALAHAQATLPQPAAANHISTTGGIADAAVSTSGNVMTINQSASKAILNWESFSVADRTKARDQAWQVFATTMTAKELPKLSQAGVHYYLPPAGAVIQAGQLVANVAYPGLTIEYSLDQGKSWQRYQEAIPVRTGSEVWLRSKAVDGRHSRLIKLPESAQ